MFRNRDLRRLSLSYAGFISTEYAVWIAMLVYAFDQGGATTAGIVAVAQLVPAALFAPYGGVLADRGSPARVLVGGYAGQAVAMAATAVALLAGGPPLVAYALAAAAATVVTITRPAQAVLVPELAHEPDDLTAFNVVSGWIESACILAAPAITGVLLGVSTAGTVFAVCAVAALGSAVAVVPLLGRPAHKTEGVDPAVQGALREIVAGLRAVAGMPACRLLLILLGTQYVLIGAVDVLAVVLAIDVLGLGDSGAGYLNAAFGAGGVLGAIAAVTLIGRGRLAPPLLAGAMLAGVSLIVLGAIPTVAGAFILLAATGAGRVVLDVSGRTLLQRIAPPDMLSRIFALVEALSMGALAIGSILVPALIAAGGATAALVAAGLVLPAVVLLHLPRLVSIDAAATVPIVELSLLRSMKIFALLPAPVLEGLARSLVAERKAAGAVIMHEGKYGDRFFAIADGEIDISKGGRLLATRARGEGFGEIALLREVRRTATATARTNALLYGLDKGPFLTAVTGHPPAAQAAEGVVEDLLATVTVASPGDHT